MRKSFQNVQRKRKKAPARMPPWKQAGREKGTAAAAGCCLCMVDEPADSAPFGRSHTLEKGKIREFDRA